MSAARCCSNLLVLALALAAGGCAGEPRGLAGGPAGGAVTILAEPARPVVQPAGGTAPAEPAPPHSAWCDYLKADAGAQASILRSPTVTGQITDSERKSATVGMDLMDFAKAHYVERGADARCRRHLASQAIARTIYVAPQSLTSAGFAAQAAAIAARSGDMAAIERHIEAALRRGDITAAEATGLTTRLHGLRAELANARSEAERRRGLDDILGASVGGQAQALIDAERELQDLEARMRSIDAVRVSVQGGWREPVDPLSPVKEEDDYYGSVTVSYRIGALSPARFAHERAARAARVAALSEAGSGVLWQSAELQAAYGRAKAGLEAKQRELTRALSQTRAIEKRLKAAASPEFATQLLAAQIEAIGLEGEVAAVAGTLADITRTGERLSQF